MERTVVGLLVLFGWVVSCTPADGPQVAEEGRASAYREVNQQIDREPNNAELYAQRAQLAAAEGSVSDAVLDLEKALSLDSMNAEYPVLLADLYLQDLKSRDALATIERAARVHSGNREVLLKLAEIQLILREYAQASTSIRKILEISPSDIDALLLLSVLFREEGDLERAAQSLQTVVELDGNHYEAWTMLGNIYETLGDDMALQCFENAIAIQPDYIPGWHGKAYFLQNRSRTSSAIGIYRSIHAMDSAYAAAYLNAGILYIEQGKLDSAAVEISFYTGLRNTDPLGPFYRGVIEEQKGDLEVALGYYNRASALAPSNPRFSEKARELRIRLGQPD